MKSLNQMKVAETAYRGVISDEQLDEMLYQGLSNCCGEPIYKELKLVQKKYSEDELIDLMEKHPELIERPIVERGSRAILARPAERILEILPVPAKDVKQ